MTAFMKPRLSPVSMARTTALIGSLATRIACPRALASRSVRPTRPSCGSMNIVYGTIRSRVLAFSCRRRFARRMR
jgi:hypothetical protein